jgi:TonB family protein
MIASLMVMLRLGLAGTMLSLFATATAASAQPRAAPAWQVDWGDQYCTLIRHADRSTPFVVAMRLLPGNDFSEMLLMDAGPTQLPERADAIILAPSGRTFPVSADQEMRPNGLRVVTLGQLPPDFWDALAGAESIQFRQGGRIARQVGVSQTAAGVRALRQCASDALRQWGVNEAALSGLRRRPLTTNGFGITEADYPIDALHEHLQGRVVMRLTVSPDGRATACAPVVSSRDSRFDQAACRAALSRARFTPALDAAGQPVAAQIVTSVTFLPPHVG